MLSLRKKTLLLYITGYKKGLPENELIYLFSFKRDLNEHKQILTTLNHRINIENSAYKTRRLAHLLPKM